MITLDIDAVKSKCLACETFIVDGVTRFEGVGRLDGARMELPSTRQLKMRARCCGVRPVERRFI
jgi:hypothetical protein